jgi:hypothetical protein
MHGMVSMWLISGENETGSMRNPQVHPTTKQHLLLARAVNSVAGQLFT